MKGKVTNKCVYRDVYRKYSSTWYPRTSSIIQEEILAVAPDCSVLFASAHVDVGERCAVAAGIYLKVPSVDVTSSFLFLGQLADKREEVIYGFRRRLYVDN